MAASSGLLKPSRSKPNIRATKELLAVVIVVSILIVNIYRMHQGIQAATTHDDMSSTIQSPQHLDDSTGTKDISRLSSSQRFIRDGYIGPIAVSDSVLSLASQAVEDVEKWMKTKDDYIPFGKQKHASKGDYESPSAPGAVWLRSSFAYVPAMFQLASHPDILHHVSSVLNTTDLMLLYGAEIIDRLPEAVHPWHSDIESTSACSNNGYTYRAATVWLALDNVTRDNNLQVISGSHRAGKAIKPKGISVNDQPMGYVELEQLFRKQSSQLTDFGRQHGKSGEIHHRRFENLTDGSFIVFDGRLWHGSVYYSNASTSETRRALVLQYAHPSCAIRLPDINKGAELTQYLPPVVLLKSSSSSTGTATSYSFINNIVQPPPPFSGVNQQPGFRRISNEDDIMSETPIPIVVWNREKNHRPLFSSRDPNQTRQVNSILLGSTCLGHLMLNFDETLVGISPHDIHTHADADIIYNVWGNLQIHRVRGQYNRNLMVNSVLDMLPDSLLFHPNYEPHTQICVSPTGMKLEEVDLYPSSQTLDHQDTSSPDDRKPTCGYYSLRWSFHKDKTREQIRDCIVTRAKGRRPDWETATCSKWMSQSQMHPGNDACEAMHIQSHQSDWYRTFWPLNPTESIWKGYNRNSSLSSSETAIMRRNRFRHPGTGDGLGKDGDGQLLCRGTCSLNHGLGFVQVHTTTGAAGYTLEPHVDAHDLIMIVKKGRVDITAAVDDDDDGYKDTELYGNAGDVIIKPAGYVLGLECREGCEFVAIELHHAQLTR